jgi:aryl-alcohol dehydrogenase-like predicted oxidoreductase
MDHALETRTLGTSGLEVSALGLGCMALNYHRSTTVTRDEAIELLADGDDTGYLSVSRTL